MSLPRRLAAKVEAEVEAALGASVTAARSLAGGDINEAFDVHLADGRRAFVKTHPSAPPTMYSREAEGLAWLAEPGVIRVPAVLAATPRLLALEHVDAGAPAADHAARLGRELAALHTSGADGFGGPAPNFIGRLDQDNTPEADWATFYARRRLEPQLRLAVDAGRASDGMRRGFARLFDVLADRVGPPEPPARLHGDLWGGNALTGPRGEPVLIDPAVYGGHREVDLAMMQLFGGFSPRTFDAYREAAPLADGWRARVPLYQLYPLLVHVNLFGGGYVGSVERALTQVL